MNYGETLWSDLFAGRRSTMSCLEPAVLAVETSLDLAMERRRHTVYRLDGGSGTDDKLSWLIDRGYHVIAKGYSATRARALARRVVRWDPYGADAFIGAVSSPVDYGRPVQVIVKKWLLKGQWQTSFYVSTLKLPSKQAVMRVYDERGGAEIEQFREDKSGLYLSERRKRTWQAQKTLVLLTDLTHNLLADFRYRGLAGSSFAQWGRKRIVRDLLQIPGLLSFDGTELKRIDLLAAHPYAEELITCLKTYCSSSPGELKPPLFA